MWKELPLSSIIEALDKKLEEIIGSVDSVETADKYVQDRPSNKEDESVLLSSSKRDDQSSVLSISFSHVKQKQQKPKEETERFLEVKKEQSTEACKGHSRCEIKMRDKNA